MFKEIFEDFIFNKNIKFKLNFRNYLQVLLLSNNVVVVGNNHGIVNVLGC